MMQPIKSPFRWYENRQPSIFATDRTFANLRYKAPPPAASQFSIATPAQSQRTQSIKGRA